MALIDVIIYLVLGFLLDVLTRQIVNYSEVV